VNQFTKRLKKVVVMEGNLCYKHLAPLKEGNSPGTNVATAGKLCAATKGVKNVNAPENQPTRLGSAISAEASSPEKARLSYTSDSYQKILDYHVGEILLTTIIFGVILLFRMHH
jgi:hypothetical protein